MEKRRWRVVAWAACALWMAFIFSMSAAPGDVSGAQSGTITKLLMALLSPFFEADAEAAQAIEMLVRKGAHMAEYAVLFLLYRAALRVSGVSRAGSMALLLTVGYAATDEFHQRFVPGRGPSAVDVMIDGCGALVAWGMAALTERISMRAKGR